MARVVVSLFLFCCCALVELLDGQRRRRQQVEHADQRRRSEARPPPAVLPSAAHRPLLSRRASLLRQASSRKLTVVQNAFGVRSGSEPNRIVPTRYCVVLRSDWDEMRTPADSSARPSPVYRSFHDVSTYYYFLIVRKSNL